jgi:hypothetical protein
MAISKMDPIQDMCFKKPLWRSRGKKNSDHTQEDLAKSGYKPDMNYKSLISLLYLWLHTEK